MVPAYVVLIIFIFYLLYKITTKKFDYWKIRNVAHVPPAPIVGNYGPLVFMKHHIGRVVQELCQKFPQEPYIGAFFGTEPTLIVMDPEFIRLVTKKDFYYFNSREIADHTHKEVLTQNVFFNYGDNWKAVRQQLTPLFSSSKMRNMFPLIEKCCLSFESYVDNETSASDVMEVRTLMTRFTMACITSCGFGAEVDTLNKKNRNSPFIRIGRLIFLNTYTRAYLTLARSIWPSIFYGLGLKNFPDELINFFKYFVTGVFESREYQPTSRNDFIDLILNLRKQKHIVADCLSNLKTGKEDRIEVPITDDLLVSQCIVFFAAGFETSSATLTFVLYELAKKPEAQKKVLEEVDRYLATRGNRLDYDCMTELPYTMACLNETMRIHPVLGVITRELVENYTMPNGLSLNKGVRVHLPVYYLHHNPEFFPEPESFRPERFLGENKNDIKPQYYMPFGDGPRICVGRRFAKMQMLAGLVTLLKKFEVNVTEKTPKTLDYDPRAIVTIPQELIHLQFTPRSGWEERLFPRLVEENV